MAHESSIVNLDEGTVDRSDEITLPGFPGAFSSRSYVDFVVTPGSSCLEDLPVGFVSRCQSDFL